MPNDHVERPREADRLEKSLRTVPMLGHADDPLFFVGICVVATATIAALLLAPVIAHDGHADELRDILLKLAGGVLIMLGAYTAVRTIIGNRANGASQAFASLLTLLAGDGRTKDAALVGAIRHLPDLARRRGADADAIEAVIAVLLQSQSAGDALTAAAEEAGKDLPTVDERRAPDHGRPVSRDRSA
jgi:hypothetical protein